MTPAPDQDSAGASNTCALSLDALAVRAGLAKMAAGPPLSFLTPDQRGTAEVVLAEVLNNIAEHAYAGGPGKITVMLGMTGAGLLCEVVDTGAAMPGGRLPEGRHPVQPPGSAIGPDGVPLSQLPEGGFGWYMIRRLTQDLTYARSLGQNRLGFVIPLDGRPAG